MNSIFWRLLKTAVIATVLVILTGCTYNNGPVANAVAQKAAWLAYWDLEAGEKDLARIGKKIEKISYFGAYFDKNDHLFIPGELSAKKFELTKKKEKYETYLTFVNDKQKDDDLIEMKDIEVLRRLFSTDVLLEKHIDEIIALTLQGDYDGIEIDYERIWKDEAIGQSFLRFVDKLYVKALKNNLKVRVVLEPGTPFASTGFIKGPEYVVMLYNLYGLHSSPGPKADRAFIQKTLTLMKVLPGEKTVAFSTGGCLWSDKGEKRFLTEVEAKTLAMVYDAKPYRDKESQCVVFSYQANNISYEVWYADLETLNYWISLAKEYGADNIGLWRLGGNVDINKIK